MKKHRSGAKERRRARRRNALTAFTVALVAVMLGLSAYVAHWYISLGRIRAEGERYASLYDGGNGDAGAATVLPSETLIASPTVVETPTPGKTPQASPAPTEPPGASETPTAIPTAVASESPTPAPTVPRTPTPAPTVPTPTLSPAPTPQSRPGADMPVVEDVPIPTPDADTLVIALPTPPPVQQSFESLLALNPDTVGFLDVEDMLSLPVVQRENDNDHYLDHSFEGREAREGTLFLDGMNRLTPEDDCLIVYGHNMKNKTMFGRLSDYGDVNYLRRHPIVRFDTLYENRSYVAFAAFTASMEPGNSRYFDVRQFIFDENEFDKFVLKLQSRSRFRTPIDVRFGDRLLLLVTCDYTSREGRFILALRQLRPDENEAGAWAQAMGATEK